jgi:hypothetical protein
MSLPVPAATTVSSLTKIRERTRNAIAQHRVWRRQPTAFAEESATALSSAPDVRRMYVGTSAATHGNRGRGAVPPSPLAKNASRDSSTSSNSSSVPPAEDVYRDIEAQEQKRADMKTRGQQLEPNACASLVDHGQGDVPPYNTGQLPQQPLNDSMENHLQSLEHQFSSSSPGNKSRTSVQDTKTVLDSHPERATIIPQIKHMGHYESMLRQSRLLESGYQLPAPFVGNPKYESQVRAVSPQQHQGMIYRDDGSVMTGMSQQELIRKKTRSTLRQREKQKKFRTPRRRNRRTPIVQLPANLFSMQPSARISTPQQNYYLPHSSLNGDDAKLASDDEGQIAARLASLRWNSNSRSAAAAIPPQWSQPMAREQRKQQPEEELYSFSTTAEIANASGESLSPSRPAAPLPLPHRSQRPTIDTAARTTPPTSTHGARARSAVPLTSSPAVLSVRGGETLCIESLKCLDDQSFSVMSKNSEQDVDKKRAHQERLSTRSREANDDEERSKDTENNPSTGNDDMLVERKGVRFAAVVHERFAGNAGDDWSEVPWDQKTDQQAATERSPASVMEAIHNEYPKSILREPRFKPDPLLSRRCLSIDRRILDFESEHLLYTGEVIETSRSIDTARLKDTEAEAATARHQSGASLRKARLAKCREVNSSLEMSPPRNNSGFMDKEGLELSPIQTDASVASREAQSSFVPGHPAEKHLREKMAMVREMRGGEIADLVIEEEHYPDPPLEIDVSMGFCSEPDKSAPV